jgi:phosphoadenosine phosphosulfate reductase
MNLLEKIEDAKWLISRTLELYPHVGVACSFGKDSMVLLDLCRQVKPDIQVFSLLADTEFDETMEFAHRMVREWNLNYHEFIYHQKDLIIGSPDKCCNAAKLEAVKEAVKGLDAWITGVRLSEGETRKDFLPIDDVQGLVKINPILEFTEMDIWRYTAIFELPINSMYKLGYRSLGCRYCSSPEKKEEESERSGRWRGSNNAGGECGIHVERLNTKN